MAVYASSLTSSRPDWLRVGLGGFVGGGLLVGCIAVPVAWFLRELFPSQETSVLFAGAAVVIAAGVLGAGSSVRAIRKTVEWDEDLAQRLDHDMSSGLVRVHHGELLRIVQAWDVNPEHPPYVLTFKDGEVFTLSSLEVEARGFSLPRIGKGPVQIVMAPTADWIVTIAQTAA